MAIKRLLLSTKKQLPHTRRSAVCPRRRQSQPAQQGGAGLLAASEGYDCLWPREGRHAHSFGPAAIHWPGGVLELHITQRAARKLENIAA